jgi:hypothetical protein
VEDVLAAIEEADGIYQELPAACPDAFRLDLERSLRVATWLQRGESDASTREPKQR